MLAVSVNKCYAIIPVRRRNAWLLYIGRDKGESLRQNLTPTALEVPLSRIRQYRHVPPAEEEDAENQNIMITSVTR
jgi:hypothetical protein